MKKSGFVISVATIFFVSAVAMHPSAAALVNWSLASDGFWDVAGNWSPSAPATNDDVVIGISGNRTITFQTGTLSINTLTITNNSFNVTGGALTVSGAYNNSGTGGTSISGGILTLNGPSSLGSFVQSSGSIAGVGTTTITGAANITFGDHRGTGTTILQGATSISSSGLRLDGGRVLRNEGALTWSGGQILFNNTFNGASGGPGSGTINNVAGATFVASGDNATSIVASNFGGADTGADAVINNAGTFRKSGSSAGSTTTVDVAFNNTGTVQAQTGVLNLTNGGSHTGNFDVAAGAVLGFGGGTHNLNGGSITSPGTARISSGAVNVNTNYNIAGTTDLQGGFLNLVGGNLTTGAFSQSNGSVSGPNNLTVTGAANITFGDHRGTGTTILQGATSISSSGLRLDGGRVLRNEGALTWSGGQILFNNTFNGASGGPGSGTINNVAGATFVASGDNATSIVASNFGGADTGADAVINNAGTFRKSGSSAGSTTTVDVAFNNTGTVQAQTGVLNLTNGGSHTGNFDVAAGAVLGFGGGTHNLNGGSITSPGTARISSGAVNVNTNYNIAGTTDLQGGFLNLVGGNLTTGAFSQSNGSVSGPNNLTVTGAANITFGDHRGTGTTILQGATSISSSGLRLDGGRVLRNEGALTWSGGQILFNNTFNGASGGPGSGTINNVAGATFVASGDNATSIVASNFGGADTGADAVINNAGTFRKSGSSAGSTTTVDVAFNNTGTVQAQTGVLNFASAVTNAGVFETSAGATLKASGPLSNYSGATNTLSGGTYKVSGNGTFAFTGADIHTNAATIVLSGVGSQITDQNGIDGLRNLAANAGLGDLTITAGRNLTTLGAFSNAGRLAIGSSSTFNVSGNYTQTHSGGLAVELAGIGAGLFGQLQGQSVFLDGRTRCLFARPIYAACR